MQRKILFWLFASNLATVGQIHGQGTNKRCIQVAEDKQEVRIEESLLIDPGTIVVKPGVEYSFDSDTRTIYFEKKIGGIEVCYRVFPIGVGTQFSHKSTELYDSTASFRPVYFDESTTLSREELFSTPNLYKTGSLTRGVTFGNTQSVNVVSNFNFQMDGALTENLNIRADITDQNVPFQPEGNTLQLREFDNVLIEIYNEDFSLKAGDVLLQDPNSNFLRYYKNVLGGSADVSYKLNSAGGKGRSKLAVGSAKGQFVDITLQAEEGLQGPYQLRGPDGQNFVIVLANSEKVYLDGRLMKRGYNHDYTIDYNLGEVTFNPGVLITRFSRIRVTFEYSDQNYSRSIVNAEQELDFGKLSMNMAYYREKDDLNRPLVFELSDEDKIQMSLAGDDNLPVPISSERQVAFNPNLPLYERKDTLDASGNLESVFVFSRDSTQALYQVAFTQVGAGNGDYVLVQNDVNGRVYEWTSPIGNISQGEYAPIRFVPAPNMRQMATLGAKYDFSRHISVFSEVAFSNHDLNLYSQLGNENNKDLANKTGLVVSDLPVGLGKYKLSGHVDYEYDGRDFRPIDRYRVIEFDRNWSYSAQADTFRTADNIFHSTAQLYRDQKNFVSARYSLRQKELAIDGYQHEYVLSQSLGPLNIKGSFFGLESENFMEKSEWKRWHAETFLDQFFVVPGYKIEADQNEVGALNSDSLTRTAMNFLSHEFYLRSHDTLKTHFRLDYNLREDKSILDGRLLPFSLSKTTSASVMTPQSGSHSLNLTLTYRELEFQEPFAELEDESTFLGRVSTRNAFFKNHIRTDLNYATSSSREILREFIYVQVQPGEGTHTWRDLNGDGIQDLTEFFEAVNFDERNYIRVFVPTTEFVNAFNTIFIFNLNVQMPRSWSGKAGLKDWLSKFSNQTNFNTNKKTTEDGFNARFNPFESKIENEDLIFSRNGFRTTFFYNRTGKGLGGDFTYTSNQSKQQISRGVDSRELKNLVLNFRYHINREVSLTAKMSQGEKLNASEFQENRNYRIEHNEVRPGFIWQPTGNVRLACTLGWMRKENVDAEMDEYSIIQDSKIDSRWSMGGQNSLNASFSFSRIEFEGDENTASAYELLNALRPGDNISWHVNYSQKLISGLQMTLGYEGRKSEEQAVIHQGKVQITALF